MPNSRVSSQKKRIFQRLLLQWFRREARELPWRMTRDPYAIMVSEMMLQQTQVDRVIPKFEAFMKAFPDVSVLATAPQEDVVRLWQGLGYNRRALYLQKAARAVVEEHSGVFPRTPEELQTLPGIGPYTAGAIASFAFGVKTPIVDTNVERVIGRIFLGYQALPQTTQLEFWQLMQKLLPEANQIWKFNQALMDHGAIVCKARKPECGVCPFQQICASYPKIVSASPAELRYKRLSNETLYFGKPRRIWRGRILKHLHSLPEESATLLQIGHAIQEDFTAERIPWLSEVIASLQKDGFLIVNKKTVSLQSSRQ